MDKKNAVFVVISVVLLIIALLLVGLFYSGKGTDNSNLNNPNLNNQNSNLNENIDNANNSNENFEPNVKREENGTKVNISEAINKNLIEVEEFELTNISLKYADGITDFTADVRNNSEVDYKNGVEMTISFLNEDGSLIYSLPVLTSTLMAGSTTIINSRTTIDCTNAYDISISVDK